MSVGYFYPINRYLINNKQLKNCRNDTVYYGSWYNVTSCEGSPALIANFPPLKINLYYDNKGVL